MILVLNKRATTAQIESLQQKLKLMRLESFLSNEENYKTIAILSGIDQYTRLDLFTDMEIVDQILPYQEKTKLIGKDIKKTN